jgi:hypothetical protein
MAPGPDKASPPLTDQVMLAEPPPERVNCSEAPDELVELQPVQLVSMVAVPGEREMPPLGLAETAPPQPARANSAGPAKARRRGRTARKRP